MIIVNITATKVKPNLEHIKKLNGSDDDDDDQVGGGKALTWEWIWEQVKVSIRIENSLNNDNYFIIYREIHIIIIIRIFFFAKFLRWR